MQKLCKLTEVPLSLVAGLVASPPCESFSLADCSNLSRENHHRDHSHPDKPPRAESSCTQESHHRLRQKAIEHDLLVRHVITSFIRDRQNGLHYDLLLENPVGSLRKRPYMRGEALESLTTRHTVNYCAYGEPYSKATDFWSSMSEWQPQGTTGNGRCNDGACQQGVRKRNKKFAHKVVIGGPSNRRLKKVEGKTYKQQIWKIPEPLTIEYMRHFKKKHGKEGQKRVVFDLFSGGESWRRAVEAAGFIYVPVDLKTLTT